MAAPALPVMNYMEMVDLVDLNEPMCRAYWLGQFVTITTLCIDKIDCHSLRVILRNVGIRNKEFVDLYRHMTGKEVHTHKDDVSGIKWVHGVSITPLGVEFVKDPKPSISQKFGLETQTATKLDVEIPTPKIQVPAVAPKLRVCANCESPFLKKLDSGPFMVCKRCGVVEPEEISP